MNRRHASSRFRFSGAALLLVLLAFLIPALREGDSRLYLLAALVPAALLLCTTVLARLFSMDRLLLSLSLYLCALGILAPAVSDPGVSLAQAARCGAGVLALLAGTLLVRSLTPTVLAAAASAFAGLLLLLAKSVSASLTVDLTQPAMVLLTVSCAALLSRQRTVWAFIPGILAPALMLLQEDTASAVLWCLVFLLLLWTADGRLFPCLSGLVLCAALFPAFRLLRQPAAVPAVPLPQAVSLSVLVSAGLFGADAYAGGIPSASSSLFPVLAAHYGLIFTGFTVLLFLPLAQHGLAVAASSRSRFHGVLAAGCSLLLVLRVLAALLSGFGVLTFFDGSLPFLTSSLPDLCSQLFLIGLLCGIAARNEDDLSEDAHLAMLSK